MTDMKKITDMTDDEKRALREQLLGTSLDQAEGPVRGNPVPRAGPTRRRRCTAKLYADGNRSLDRHGCGADVDAMKLRVRQPYDKLYRTTRWRKRRALQLKQYPLCAKCLDRGIVTPAEVADHVVPHKGDHNLFFFGEIRSLCHAHHSGTKQQEEKRGFASDIGVDGWPVDERHMVYRR